MQLALLAICLLAQPPAADDGHGSALESLRAAYRADAEQYEFQADATGKTALKLVEKPIMRWFNDNDWSGDVFVWAQSTPELADRPAIVGCILSGPTSDANRRIVFHEFHLLAETPIAAARLHAGGRWSPAEGLKVSPVPDAPQPADSASGRLVQMRQLSREFTAHMNADGVWELRLLPQPLYRYGREQSDARADIIDGALFTYVWTRGTDPEVILLLECRRTASGMAWHYAPVRFSNREVWLKHDGNEVWRAESHREPGDTTTLLYTTTFARDLTPDAASPAGEPQP